MVRKIIGILARAHRVVNADDGAGDGVLGNARAIADVGGIHGGGEDFRAKDAHLLEHVVDGACALRQPST